MRVVDFEYQMDYFYATQIPVCDDLVRKLFVCRNER
jgi:hypothetical protein